MAHGALEAGVEFAASYPGGPITGIMAGLFDHASPGLHVEWCPNEKDAVAGAFGAALVGRRALAVVKHVGLSVASDAVTAAAFTGVRGALVVATWADPGGRVSQKEMDERPYADLFMLPMLEPSSPADAVRITRYAFELSEGTGAPVLLRVSSAFLRISESLPPQPSPPPDDGERSFRYEATPERTALGRFILDSNRNRQRRFARASAKLESAGLDTVEGDATARLGIVTCGPTLAAVRAGLRSTGMAARILCLRSLHRRARQAHRRSPCGAWPAKTPRSAPSKNAGTSTWPRSCAPGGWTAARSPPVTAGCPRRWTTCRTRSASAAWTWSPGAARRRSRPCFPRAAWAFRRR